MAKVEQWKDGDKLYVLTDGPSITASELGKILLEIGSVAAKVERIVSTTWGDRDGYTVLEIAPDDLTVKGQPPTVVLSYPEFLVGATLVEKGTRQRDGDDVILVTPVYVRFLKELEKDPNALYHLTPRQFEELIAGGYREAGFDEVILTPASGDRGRDVIAVSKEFGTIRIVDQVKLYAPTHLVTAEEVRALYGVLTLDRGASKAIVSTSSAFAPGIYTEFADVMPGRLSLRDGAAIAAWLKKQGKP
jgi:restriction system protein